MDNIFASIHLNSNRPDNIKDLISNIERTASTPSGIEVIINIDNNDNNCKNIIENLKNTSLVKIIYIQTDIIKSFKDLWKPYNQLLGLTNKNAEFVSLFSDEFRFKTKGWDDILKKYINYYNDGIFRIRLSRYRFRNYTDFWECIFAPDSLAFYSKKWIDIVGMWCPCTGPDSWQQLVSFYLTSSRKFDHIQYNRDVSENFIEILGEDPGQGMSKLESRQRNIDNADLWFDETIKYESQLAAKKAAALLQAEIIMHQNSCDQKISYNFTSNRKPPIFIDKKINDIKLIDNKKNFQLDFFWQNNLIYKIDYKVNKIKLFFINNWRKLNYPYYAGGGMENKGDNIIDSIYTYHYIRKYGNFGYRKILNFPKPQFISLHGLDIFWELFINIAKIFKLLLIFFRSSSPITR